MRKRAIISLIAVLFFFNYSSSSGEDNSWKKREIAEILRSIDNTGGDQIGYCKEILSMLENTCGIKCRPEAADTFDEVDRFDEQKESVDIYSSFSGGVSLRSSMQLETVPPSSEKSGTIDPASLSSPAFKKIQYADMIRGKKIKTFPMDRYTPAEFYYIHLSDAAKIFDLITYIDETAGAVQRQFSNVSVDYMTKEKILTQLALKEDKNSREFYSSSIEDTVIAGSDPFIVEGSDVTVIVKPKSSSQFINTVKSIRRDFKERYKCEEKDITVAGVTGAYLYSGERRINSLMFTLPDGTSIISNSPGAAGIVIETYMGRHSSLAESPDYLYMRTIYPADSGQEDAFIYLSDSFIKYLSSPLLKIKEARRMREAMRLAVIEKYAVYYRQLTGKRSSSIDEILSVTGDTSLNESRKRELASIKRNPSYSKAAGLTGEFLASWEKFESQIQAQPQKKKRSKKSKKRDTGSASLANAMKVFYRNMTGDSAGNPEAVIRLIEQCDKPGGFNSKRFNGISILDGSYTAENSALGRIGYMLPCIDMNTVYATEGEAEDYRDFARNFSSSSEASISPAGIKFIIQNKISVDAFMIRTDANPLYSFLSAFTGGIPAQLHPDSSIKGDVVSIALKADQGMVEKYLSQNEIKINGINGKPLNLYEILSGEVQLHMSDTLPPASFNSSSFRQLLRNDGFGTSDTLSGFVLWAMLHPVRLAIPVKNNVLARTFINSIIKSMIEKGNSSNIYQCDSFSFEYDGSEINVLKLTILKSLSARIYFTVKNNTLHIVTNERYLKNVLDARSQLFPSGERGNALLILHPSDMTQEADIYKSGIIEDAMSKSMKNFGIIRLASILYPDASTAELPDLVYKNFGFRPVCPLGGEYLVDKKNGEITNSLFGSNKSPSLHNGTKGSGPVYNGINKFFTSEEIRSEIEFYPDGMRLRISSR